jgi:hypothetical protein
MFSFMSNKLIRRGTGVFAIVVMFAICIAGVSNSATASGTNRGVERVSEGNTPDRSEGDGDNVGGARVKIHSDVTTSGECGGGANIIYKGVSCSAGNQPDKPRLLKFVVLRLSLIFCLR